MTTSEPAQGHSGVTQSVFKRQLLCPDSCPPQKAHPQSTEKGEDEDLLFFSIFLGRDESRAGVDGCRGLGVFAHMHHCRPSTCC